MSFMMDRAADLADWILELERKRAKPTPPSHPRVRRDLNWDRDSESYPLGVIVTANWLAWALADGRIKPVHPDSESDTLADVIKRTEYRGTPPTEDDAREALDIVGVAVVGDRIGLVGLK